MGNVIPFVRDSLRSLVGMLGNPLRDKRAGVYYDATMLSFEDLANAYRSSWIARKVVDIPALDSIRKGRDWSAKNDQIELIEALENRLGYWPKLLEARIKARLWGGAGIYIGTGDANLAEPLDPERVGKDGIKYLTVLTRNELSAREIDRDVASEFYGRPKLYTLNSKDGGASVDIHPSRIVTFIGAPIADPSFAEGNGGWGDSVLQVVFDAMKNADSTAANIASLVFEAKVDVIRVPDLMVSLADDDYKTRLTERFSLASANKGINGTLLLDKEEEYETKSPSFAQLPEIMQTMLQMAAGAADIPVTRFLGQSPSGMSATGESDMRNYYDRIQSAQNLEMTPATYRLDECLIRAALGNRPPEVNYRWSPLWQLSDTERSTIAKTNADTAKVLNDTGMFTGIELRTVVANQLVESGFYPGLEAAMDDTGKDFDPDLGADDPAEGDPAANPAEVEPNASTKPIRMQRAANDATPRTLYVSRTVRNADDIIAWAAGQGFTSTLAPDDLHVTIMYSRQPVDWMKCGQPWDSELKLPAGGPRLIEVFGQGAVVLLFKSSELEWRHQAMKDIGATWDHPEYQPHITISYEGAPADLSKVQPYQGEIVLGPEIFAEVNEDWKAKVTKQ